MFFDYLRSQVSTGRSRRCHCFLSVRQPVVFVYHESATGRHRSRRGRMGSDAPCVPCEGASTTHFNLMPIEELIPRLDALIADANRGRPASLPALPTPSQGTGTWSNPRPYPCPWQVYGRVDLCPAGPCGGVVSGLRSLCRACCITHQPCPPQCYFEACGMACVRAMFEWYVS